MAIYVNPISAESAEAYANRINEGFKDDESEQYKPSTVGEFSGFRKVSVTVEQFYDTDTTDMEVAMKAILGNMKVEVK